jgi:hypothetical protein
MSRLLLSFAIILLGGLQLGVAALFIWSLRRSPRPALLLRSLTMSTVVALIVAQNLLGGPVAIAYLGSSLRYFTLTTCGIGAVLILIMVFVFQPNK